MRPRLALCAAVTGLLVLSGCGGPDKGSSESDLAALCSTADKVDRSLDGAHKRLEQGRLTRADQKAYGGAVSTLIGQLTSGATDSDAADAVLTWVDAQTKTRIFLTEGRLTGAYNSDKVGPLIAVEDSTYAAVEKACG